MKDTTNIVGMNGNLWNDIKIEDIKLVSSYNPYMVDMFGAPIHPKSFYVKIQGFCGESTEFQIHPIEYKKLERIIEEYNETKKEKEKDMKEKNEIRDGWYKIKNKKDIDGAAVLFNCFDKKLPKHRTIKIVDCFWHGWLIQPEVILHEYFNYGECVYVRDFDSQEWRKAKYHDYSNRSSSQRAEVSECAVAWSYCISEAEWKEKYERKPIEIQIIDGSSYVANIPIHDNEKIIITRCSDKITYTKE